MQVEHYVYNFLSLLRYLVDYSLLKNTCLFTNTTFEKFDFYISGVEKSIKLNFKKFCLILLNLEFIIPGLWNLKFVYVFDKKTHKKKIFFKFITYLLNYKLFFLFLFNFRFLKNVGFNYKTTNFQFSKKVLNKQIFLLNKVMFVFKLRFINTFFIQTSINKNYDLTFKYNYFLFFL